MGQFTRSLRHRPFETCASTACAHEVGKGNRRTNAPSRSIRRSGHPILASAATRLRAFDRDLIRGEHYGQRPCNSAASTGRTHGSTDQLCINVKKPLPTGSRPHMARSRLYGMVNLGSALPSKADSSAKARNLRFGNVPSVRFRGAASIGQRNTSVKSLCRRFKRQRFARPLV